MHWGRYHDVDGDLGGFILLDHFKETVHGVLEGFGIHEPWPNPPYKRCWISWGAELGGKLIQLSDGVRLQLRLGEKPLLKTRIISVLKNRFPELTKGNLKVKEEKTVNADRTSQGQAIQERKIPRLGGPHFIGHPG